MKRITLVLALASLIACSKKAAEVDHCGTIKEIKNFMYPTPQSTGYPTYDTLRAVGIEMPDGSGKVVVASIRTISEKGWAVGTKVCD